MLGDGLPNSGTQGSYFKYQYGVLKLLESINNAIAALPGVDYETRTTNFEVIAGPTPPGAGYSIGDFLVRYDIIDVATGTVVQTIWFNQSLQTTLVGAGNPNPADITPTSASLSVTVLNPFNLEATQLLIHGLLTAIDADTSNLDVLLSSRASETTVASILTQLDVALSTRASETTVSSILTQLDVALSTRNAEATQLLVKSVLDAIKLDTANLDGKVNDDYGVSTGAVRTAAQVGNTTGEADFNTGAPGAQTLRTTEAYVTRTPTMLRATAAAAATIPAGTRSVAFFNASSTALATVLGTVLKQGEQVSFEPGMNDILPEIAYNADSTTAGGGDLLITYVS